MSWLNYRIVWWGKAVLIELDVDDIVAENKIIKERLIWKQENSTVYVIEPIEVKSKIHNSIIFQVRHSPNKLSLVLRDPTTRPSQIFRRYDTCPLHRNPSGEILPPGHKHKWTDAFEERVAYMPNPPINPPTNGEEIYQAIVDFLDECNINLEQGVENYPKPDAHVQRTLGDYLYPRDEISVEEEFFDDI